MPKYLVNFAHTKEPFRLPELRSLCSYFSLGVSYTQHAYDPKSPYMVIELEDDKAALKILSRGILIREIIALMAAPADILEEIHAELKASPACWEPYASASFKFDVDSFGKRIHGDDKTVMIDSFGYCGLNGDIKMHGADVTFSLKVDTVHGKYYFGRFVGLSSRDLMERFDLKKRAYLGTTSFEAELSLVMSNIAMVGPGTLVLDPFVGTGSFLYTTSAFGAYSLGSDIDGRQLRGSEESNFHKNLYQYGVEKQVLGGLVQDLHHHAFRDGLKFDAIVTDPPYGIRAGARKIGGFDSDRPNLIPKDRIYRTTRYPKTVPYELKELVTDLFDFGAKFLKPKGRLLFWYAVDHGQKFDPNKDMPRDARFNALWDCLQSCRDFDRWLVVAELIE